MKHRTLLVLSLALGVALFTFLACGSADNTGSAVSSSSSNGSSGSTAPASAPKHFAIGQTVKVGDVWSIQVLSAKTAPGSTYVPASPGNEYLILQIAVKNISNQEQTISSLIQFHLQDATGQEYQVVIDPDAGATLDGKVEAGSPKKGSIVYQIPKNVRALTLGFEANVIESGQTLWDIKV
jgi:hypothetical protein